MVRASLFSVLFLIALTGAQAEELSWVKAPEVKVDPASKQWTVSFELSRMADVEVAIVDAANGVVVRHLAAGVLGKNPPAPLKADSAAQQIVWDGKDDYGQTAADASKLAVRVRAGMGSKLKQIVGGDPYAFYSKEMGQGDHAAWRLTGMEAKSDGKVYVMGNADNYGPPAIRQYDAKGEFQRTVFPPPAGKPLDAVKGWGVNVREDGSYTPQYNDLSSPALSKTPICGTRGAIADLVPSSDPNSLLISFGYRLMKVNTDGTISDRPMLEDKLVNEPSIVADSKKKDPTVVGPMQVCPAADGKHFYLSGVFGASSTGRDRTGASKTGFWRDGQIFKVDAATRKAAVFFALPEDKVLGDFRDRGPSPIADFKYGTYAAIQGVAADAEGHVFACDRQNKRVLVLDAEGKILREIPVEYPDAIAVGPKSKALYVTTRFGHFHGAGKLTLLKFNDWSKDTAPAATEPLCPVHHFNQTTYMAAVESNGETFVWVAYTALPVRVYKDSGAGLQLVKDFYEAGPQRALDLQHFIVDSKTENVYVADGFNNCFLLNDWSKPQFKKLMVDDQTPLRALSLAIDPRNRFLYTHQDRRPVARFRMDGAFLVPAPPDGSKENAFTPELSNDWRIGLGMGDRGIAVAFDGSLVSMNALGRGPDYGGYLRFHSAGTPKGPKDGLLFKDFEKVRAAGVRFDLQGNLYAGKTDGKVENLPKGFEKDRNLLDSTGRIYKFAPTGSRGGNLFPTAPEAPAKVYDVPFGAISPSFSRTPWFGVDGYGRIYYPSSLLPRVGVVDNEGNAVLSFGTYGNRDSMGGLEGDLVPTPDIPLAYPHCVDATDDWIYVSDIVNIRLLRIEKSFMLSATAKGQ